VPDLREVEERRYAAVTALRAMVECLRETNPQAIFLAGGKADAGGLDSTKLQTIGNRWADKASDVLLNALTLADRIGADALDAFDGSTHAPGAERRPAP
jgi:hypothetical protein